MGRIGGISKRRIDRALKNLSRFRDYKRDRAKGTQTELARRLSIARYNRALATIRSEIKQLEWLEKLENKTINKNATQVGRNRLYNEA